MRVLETAPPTRWELGYRGLLGTLPEQRKSQCIELCIYYATHMGVCKKTHFRDLRCSVINLAKLIQRQLATGERHGDPATRGGAAEVEVPEGSRRSPVSWQAQAEQFPACVQVPQPQGGIGLTVAS